MKTSGGAGCICDYTNTKSPLYTLYTLEKCLEKKHLSLLLNINISDMNEKSFIDIGPGFSEMLFKKTWTEHEQRFPKLCSLKIVHLSHN